MSIDFHRLMAPINNNRLTFIDYIDYIDCFPMIDFHRLGRPGLYLFLYLHEEGQVTYLLKKTRKYTP